jgi:hypothetical protein
MARYAALISMGSMLNRICLRGAVAIGAGWFLVPMGLAMASVRLGLTSLSNRFQHTVSPREKIRHLFDERRMVAKGRILERPGGAVDKSLA